MRIYLILIVLFTVSTGKASIKDLIDAVKADDVSLVRKILAETSTFGIPTTDVNGVESETLRRPLHYANSEEMLKVLFAQGAVFFDCQRRIYTDKTGANPLHVLFSESAAYLLKKSEDELRTIRKIERAAYTILIAFRQEVGAGWISNKPIELQEDKSGRLPVHYLRGPLWRLEFLNRFSGIHEYSISEFEEKAIQMRRLKRERELHLEERLRQDIEKFKKREEDLKEEILQPMLVRPIAVRPQMLCPQFAMGHEAAKALEFLASLK